MSQVLTVGLVESPTWEWCYKCSLSGMTKGEKLMSETTTISIDSRIVLLRSEEGDEYRCSYCLSYFATKEVAVKHEC